MRVLTVRRIRTLALFGAATVAIAGCAATATTNKHSSGKSTGSTLSVGFLGALTGARASLGQGMELGAQLGVSEINSAGGVLGHPVQLVAQDTASDPADAVAAAEFELNSDHVVAMIGPTANTTAAVLPLVSHANLPELMFGGGALFDNETNPHFFRMSPSDTEQAQAMVYYAHSKGWNKVSLAFGAAAASQSLVGPIESSLHKLGMTIVSNVSLTAGQSSYRSEVQQVYGSHPQAVLGQFNNTTAGVFFSEASQAGFQSTPFIGTNLWYSTAWVSAVGPAAAAGPIYITNSSSTGMLGAAAFIKALQAKTHSPIPANGEGFMYDAIITWALGADAAHTWTWPKIRPGILKASNPPGTACGSYKTCYALLKAGKKINWEGSQSTVDFNKSDNVFGPFAILHYSNNNFQTKSTLTPTVLEHAFA